MGTPKKQPPVKLIVGMLSSFQEALEQARTMLEARFGEIDLVSELMPFQFTSYYAEDMGTTILRQFHSFRQLIDPGSLADAKHATNELEAVLASTGRWPVRRPVNLDPGYITLSKLVLATTKDYSHRLYIGKGIYAECTLRYFNGDFRPWEWTYPDYRTEPYLRFFRKVRELYIEQMRPPNGSCGSTGV